jgi:hypothetical protein
MLVEQGDTQAARWTNVLDDSGDGDGGESARASIRRSPNIHEGMVIA